MVVTFCVLYGKIECSFWKNKILYVRVTNVALVDFYSFCLLFVDLTVFMQLTKINPAHNAIMTVKYVKFDKNKSCSQCHHDSKICKIFRRHFVSHILSDLFFQFLINYRLDFIEHILSFNMVKIAVRCSDLQHHSRSLFFGILPSFCFLYCHK